MNENPNWDFSSVNIIPPTFDQEKYHRTKQNIATNKF